MNIELILTLVLIVVLIVLFIYFNSKSIIKKTQTKLDVLNHYKKTLLKLLEENKDNKDLQETKKVEFLNTVKDELSENRFFDTHELKVILDELAKIDYK